jgi:hypothetical protein
MEAWAKEAVDLWRDNRISIAEAILEGVQQNPHLALKAYTLDDMLQMVDGGAAMIAEELEGTGMDIRDTFMQTVFPGILAQGQPLSHLVGQMTMNAVLVFNILVRKATEANRDKIARFYINWYVKLNLDIVTIGLQCGVTS